MRRWRVWGTSLGVLVLLVPGLNAVAGPPPEAIDAMPGAPGLQDGSVLLTGAVHAIGLQEGGVPLVYTRTVDSSAGTTTAGPATIVGRAASDALAVDAEGTMAYQRAADGRLVLVGADGSQEVPDWGDDGELGRFGPVALSENWIVNEYGTLHPRGPGQSYDLVEVLTGFENWTEFGFVDVVLQDSGALIQLSNNISRELSVWWLPLTDVPGDGMSLAWEGGWLVGVADGRVLWGTDSGSASVLHSVAVDDPDGPEQALDLTAAYPDPGLSSVNAYPDGTFVVAGLTTPTSVLVVRLDPATLAEVGTATIAGDQPVLGAAGGDLVALLTDSWQLADPWGGGLSGDDTPVALPATYPDAAGSVHYGAILWLADEGLTYGYSDLTYRPTTAVTRGSMAAFLYRLAETPAYVPPGTSYFSDLPTHATFYHPISWLAETGVAKGYSDGTYRSASPVTRGAAAAFFYRYAGEPAYTPPDTPRFVDVPVGASRYKEISWLAEQGITTGYTRLRYAPGEPVTRGSIATFLFRLHEAGLDR